MTNNYSWILEKTQEIIGAKYKILQSSILTPYIPKILETTALYKTNDHIDSHK